MLVLCGTFLFESGDITQNAQVLPNTQTHEDSHSLEIGVVVEGIVNVILPEKEIGTRVSLFDL